MNVGDDVTISGTIYDIRKRFDQKEDIFIKTGGGNILCIEESDIKTIHPFQPKPEKDERKGS